MIDNDWDFVATLPAKGYRVAAFEDDKDSDYTLISEAPVLAFLLLKRHRANGSWQTRVVPVTAEGLPDEVDPARWSHVLIRLDGTVEGPEGDWQTYESAAKFAECQLRWAKALAAKAKPEEAA